MNITVAIPVVKGRERVSRAVRAGKAYATPANFKRYALKGHSGTYALYAPNGSGGLKRVSTVTL